MKVLIVDDDVVSRMVLMHLIDGCGPFDVIEAEDGLDAWEQLQQGLRPDMCFCDLRMPRLSGMDLLARVKGDPALQTTPFVLVSSATDQHTLEKASALGAAGYIVKPFQTEQVRLQLSGLVAPQGAQRLAAESAQATLQRLGINHTRLLVYLGGFQSQLTGAGGDITAMLARADLVQAQLRLDRLRAGCVTLGLTGAGDALAALTPSGLSSETLHDVLTDAVCAVQQQMALVQALAEAN